MAITIVDWDKYYETNRTRILKTLSWVPMPNRHDGDGYTILIDHPNGVAHFGAWCALVQVASKCEPRGTLIRRSGEPHDAASLCRMTRIPEAVWSEALPRLACIGWIEGYSNATSDSAGPSAGFRHHSAGETSTNEEGRNEESSSSFPHSPSTSVAGGALDGPAARPPVAAKEEQVIDDPDELFEEFAKRVKATDADRGPFAGLLATHGAAKVRAAFGEFCRRSPGYALVHFNIDFADYLPAQEPAPQSEKTQAQAAHPSRFVEYGKPLPPLTAEEIAEWEARARGGSMFARSYLLEARRQRPSRLPAGYLLPGEAPPRAPALETLPPIGETPRPPGETQVASGETISPPDDFEDDIPFTPPAPLGEAGEDDGCPDDDPGPTDGILY